MSIPKVSIIVPNYNHARFLEKRLSTLLGQTFTDFELLFLDDASTDDSRAVFARYSADSRIRAIFNETNSGGPFKQWNRGVREARGEYVWIAESDDYADAKLLATLVARLEANPNIGVAYCQSFEVDEADHVGRTLDWVTDPLDASRWKSDFTNSGVDECKRYLLAANTLPNASAVVFRRTLYDLTGGADEDMKLCGDWLVWARLLSQSDVSYVAEPLNYFRQHNSTVRAQRINSLLFIFERYRIMAAIAGFAEIPESLLEPACQKMADVWEAYTRTDPTAARKWHWRVYREAMKVDPKITRRLYLKTVRPWLGGLKNRLLRREAHPRQP
jgi:glycosyltransferase involved in cell wall biosynthesis